MPAAGHFIERILPDISRSAHRLVERREVDGLRLDG
jgi:hypothetical protein